ncbi:MAG TPA: GDP-mannose 4,6-dehydratase [candidate division Zixibacteria bacterium]|nr:GDP-mannose 4,6-dehydratase [candidate division Zixibacteria bacterium]
MAATPKKRVLVTGAGGFAGSHLVDLLVNEGHEVIGTLSPQDGVENLKRHGRRITRRRCDITNSQAVSRLLKDIRPHWVFHLAAFASVGRSFGAERLTYEVNLLGSLNVLEAAAATKHLERLIVIGSADSYGTFSPRTKLLRESQPFNPISPYGISKAALERMARQHAAQRGAPVVIARPFNHTGPRQSDTFALPSFCRQIAEIELGRAPDILQVGDLTVRRDMSDVRDIVRGYVACAERGKIGEAYHLCSERAVSLRRMLDILLKSATRRIRVKVDQSRLRAADIPVLRGSAARARRELGYRPRYTLAQTLADSLEYWRDRVADTARR